MVFIYNKFKSFYLIQGVVKWFSCSCLNLTFSTMLPYFNCVCDMTYFNSLFVFGACALCVLINYVSG